ncbi:hypothetical protein SAMN04515647_2855 [Cohaesibacter sp. ES.047]|uniref:hypothetical protein n=1 Tax=Cohaesibacter sp. ES.047 TaxID=1798205 RepID=UPI000BB8786C|nr:hypothetical protein [Cohaesibacter sp. ES.047]SNY92584.1 hypothetical protein SAMN04515647_2855 [Cohaesibacter sp. ES.047]
MKISEWIKPALMGAGAGAIALAVVGFNWGGWMTSSSAEELSDSASRTAVVSALTPYCIESSKSDPMASKVLADLKAANSYQRKSIVEEAGWATPTGAEKPNGFLAQACQIELVKAM